MAMMRQCQTTVDQHAGRFVRKEVMRTEEDQSRFVPLKGYQQRREIHDKGRHWQQMVTFFVRTQREHPWKSPRYRFNPHQQDAFQRMIEAARNEMERRSASDAQDTGNRDNDDDDDGDNDNSEEEEEASTLVYLDGTPQACLEFCIALLCGKAHQHEYEHAMVCALAVLGVNERGWAGFDTYPPILSSVIKIGRMMVVQFGFQESRSVVQDKHDQDEDNGTRREVDGKTLGCIDIVTRLVDEYMPRKSHGPMEWMLDLRIYGMKIMFSSTTPGYVDWHGDQIIFKDIQFTMSQFRGMVHQIVHDLRE